MEGVDSGQVSLGLTNHYYWYGLAEEKGAENLAVQVHYFRPGDPGALVNIAGAGVLATTDQPEQAQQFVAALLSPESQTYFADETSEYPIVVGVETKDDLRPITEIGTGLPASLDSLRTTGPVSSTLALSTTTIREDHGCAARKSAVCRSVPGILEASLYAGIITSRSTCERRNDWVRRCASLSLLPEWMPCERNKSM